jgi:hypothetical protein
VSAKKSGRPASGEFEKLASRPLPGNIPGKSRIEIGKLKMDGG